MLLVATNETNNYSLLFPTLETIYTAQFQARVFFAKHVRQKRELAVVGRDDGTTVHVHFKAVPGAAKYFVWVSAHADGRGAINMTPAGATSGGLVRGLRPGKFHFWVGYQDAQGKAGKPSPMAATTLVDTFKEK